MNLFRYTSVEYDKGQWVYFVGGRHSPYNSFTSSVLYSRLFSCRNPPRCLYWYCLPGTACSFWRLVTEVVTVLLSVNQRQSTWYVVLPAFPTGTHTRVIPINHGHNIKFPSSWIAAHPESFGDVHALTHWRWIDHSICEWHAYSCMVCKASLAVKLSWPVFSSPCFKVANKVRWFPFFVRLFTMIHCSFSSQPQATLCFYF